MGVSENGGMQQIQHNIVQKETKNMWKNKMVRLKLSKNVRVKRALAVHAHFEALL
jgi:hypothetical protein